MKAKFKTKMFPKEDMLRVLAGAEPKGFKKISEEITSQNRWYTYFGVIFKHQEDFYSASFSGSTDYQEINPWEGEDEDKYICVVPKEVTIIKYEPVVV